MKKRLLSLITLLLILTLTACNVPSADPGDNLGDNDTTSDTGNNSGDNGGSPEETGVTTVTREEWTSLFSYTNYTIIATSTMNPNARAIYTTDGISTACHIYVLEELEYAGYTTRINGLFYEISSDDGELFVAKRQETAPKTALKSMAEDMQLDEMYDEFQYDATEKAYIFTLEQSTYDTAGGRATVKIYVTNKKIYKYVIINELYSHTVTFSDYGTTTVTLPEFTFAFD